MAHFYIKSKKWFDSILLVQLRVPFQLLHTVSRVVTFNPRGLHFNLLKILEQFCEKLCQILRWQKRNEFRQMDRKVDINRKVPKHVPSI